jgi:predicted RNA-binding protein with PIN domain
VTAESDRAGFALPEGISSSELDELIAPALELGVAVARACDQVRPPLPFPKPLRAMIRFAKLPPSARPAVRRALEADEEFRSRVAAAAMEIDLQPAPAALFVRRPVGWEAELSELLVVAKRTDEEAAAGRADRSLRRRLAGAEAAVARLERVLAETERGAAQGADELGAERRARREADDRAERLGRRLASVEAERDSARRRATEREAELEALRQELAALREESSALRTKVQRLSSVPEGGASMSPPPVSPPPVSPEPERPVDTGGWAAASIAEAGRAAEALGRALASAAAARDGRPGAPPVEEGRSAGHGRATPSRAERTARRERAGGRRSPQVLPPAIFDDSAEAAAHLVRVPGMLVLVDGYNVTLSTWQDLPIASQRVRLVDACGELAARCGTDVLIVFDGAEEPGDLPPPMGRSRVRWRFSPPDVEADDVLLDLVADMDTERPVTVASSDRRVRDGARSLGANAISTPQLLAVLRRDPAAGERFRT